MKKIGFIVFIVALIVGCVLANFVSWGKAGGEVFNFSFRVGGETGSGRVASETRDLSGFKSVDVSSVFEVEIVAQSEFRVEVEADDNLLEHIKTEVWNGELQISLDKKVKSSNPMRVRIGAPNIERLEVSGASRVNITNLSNEELTVDASGAAKVSVAGTTGELIVDVSGATQIDAAELAAASAVVDASGASRVNVNVSGELRSEASGASNITYTGTPAIVVKKTSGASSVSKR